MFIKNHLNKKSGFTLIEILIALFIFAIISIIATSTLHSVINNRARVDEEAQAFAKLQRTLLLISRDIEQTIDRPIIDSHGDNQAAFVGKLQELNLTRGGLDNPQNSLARSTLQRVKYVFSEGKLTRYVWSVLDQAPHTQPIHKTLLSDITDFNFLYLNPEGGRLEKLWPLTDKSKTPFPRAVQVNITLKKSGKITQLYLVAPEPPPAQTPSVPPQPQLPGIPNAK